MWGQGPLTFVAVPPVISAIELSWEEPHYERFLRRFGSFCRVIQFDKRGSGASDRVVGSPTLEERVDDLRAVMDAEGIETAAIGGVSEGGPMCMMFAALYPSALHLVLTNTTATFRGGDDYPHMPVPEVMSQVIDALGRQLGDTGDPDHSAHGAEHGRRRALSPLAQPLRAGVGEPGRTEGHDAPQHGDRHPADPVGDPRADTRRPPERRPRHPGGTAAGWRTTSPARATSSSTAKTTSPDRDEDAYLDTLEDFLFGSHQRNIDRVLATVLFTDIVDSTATAAGLGDRRWRQVLDAHDRARLTARWNATAGAW